MAYLLFVLIMLSIMYYVYESIILPSIRLRIRYKIFELRDKLRLLKIEKANELDDLTFKYCQESLNMLLAFLHRYDLSSFVEAERFLRRNPTLYKRVLKRREVLENCKLEEFQQIRNEYLMTAIWASAANSFFLIMTIAPIALAFKGMKYFVDKAKNITDELFSIPERESELLKQICIG